MPNGATLLVSRSHDPPRFAKDADEIPLPKDNIGAILAAADVISRSAADDPSLTNRTPLTMGDVLTALIKSYEIQGCFQIRNAFNKVGLDHVILVKVASTALVSWLFSLTKEQAKAAVSHAWMDGHPLRVYRQAPNTGPRKGWAAGDACMRAVHLVLLVKAGQPGAPTALTAPKWGFYDVFFAGKSFELPRPFRTWVIENVIFKVNTAEGHGMTAVEAGLEIASVMKQQNLKPDDIAGIWVRTTEAGMIIIDKRGPLSNAADRDHCLRYMLAVVLHKGEMIQTEDYQNDSAWADDPAIERLRAVTVMSEDKQFTRDYHDPDTRSISNSVQVQLKDGTWLDEVHVQYPQGHVLHNQTPQLVEAKAKANLAVKFPMTKVDDIIKLVQGKEFDAVPVRDFVDMLAVEPVK